MQHHSISTDQVIVDFTSRTYPSNRKGTTTAFTFEYSDHLSASTIGWYRCDTFVGHQLFLLFTSSHTRTSPSSRLQPWLDRDPKRRPRHPQPSRKMSAATISLISTSLRTWRPSYKMRSGSVESPFTLYISSTKPGQFRAIQPPKSFPYSSMTAPSGSSSEKYLLFQLYFKQPLALAQSVSVTSPWSNSKSSTAILLAILYSHMPNQPNRPKL